MIKKTFSRDMFWIFQTGSASLTKTLFIFLPLGSERWCVQRPGAVSVPGMNQLCLHSLPRGISSPARKGNFLKTHHTGTGTSFLEGQIFNIKTTFFTLPQRNFLTKRRPFFQFVNPHSFGSGNFSWIRNYLIRMRKK